MYVILDIGGKQEKIEKGKEFAVNRIDKKQGAELKLSHVLFAKKGNAYQVGNPYVKGASVDCEVVSHRRGSKVIAFKYKKRKSYRRTVGHRQELTVLRVKEIHV